MQITVPYVVVALVLAGLIALVIGISRAKAAANLGPGRLHSRPTYHGVYVAILTALPAIILAGLWAGLAPRVTNALVAQGLPAQFQQLSGPEQDFAVSRINGIANALPGLSTDEQRLIGRARLGFSPMEDAVALLQEKKVVLGGTPAAYVITAAYDKASYTQTSMYLLAGISAVLAIGGFFFGLRNISPTLRARNVVERVILWLLMAASTIAVLTTFGIVMSVLIETIHFFQFVNPLSFFFGTVWDPRFEAAGAASGGSGGQFGLIPLLWGTLFISSVALLVAVPIGLLSAIYMSEYASRGFRNWAKPMLEVLAGIPTIVYGFFALTTFGPLLRDFGGSMGLNIAASSVLTAGIVMGIMIIPYVSSLSDDIINAVPQSLRDGAYALGATKSETIRQVVFPAALPGIVGAVLLAASRAVGETMIVVLAAGIAAKLTINPFEAVTTMTVKIVSQLTGDLEFTSPQTLVAFALGLTLFVITLLLNIYALYIVRKYREQYE